MFSVPPGQCPPGWMHGNGSSCYMMVLQEKTWTAAREYCRALGQGSGLVSIHSLEENAFVASLFNVSLVTAWLGLSGRAIFLGYLWSDESPVQFTNWSPQQPDSHNGQQPCVEMYSSGEWGDTGCYSVNPFICKMPRPTCLPARQTVKHKCCFFPFVYKGKTYHSCTSVEHHRLWCALTHIYQTGVWDNCDIQKQPTTTPTTVPATTLVTTTQSPDICPPEWKLWNAMCYYFGKETSPNVVNWHDARQACQRVKGADLVSILSSDENAFIKSSIQRYRSDKVWIGLNDLGTEASYKWSDGSPLIYTSFAASEPNDFHGQEDCTEFWRREGKWNDMPCSAKAPYICKTHNNSVIPSNPTFLPTNGSVLWRCKEGWINYDKSCYLVVSDNLQTWQNAKNACVSGPNISMHGDLVTVNDQYEQAFLITISLKLKQNLWIGLNHRLPWGFFWADSSAPKYTNWDVKQPGSNYEYKCVSMTYSRDAGRWSIVPCMEEIGFICEAGALPVSSNNTGPTSAAPSNITCPGRYKLLGDDCYFVSYVKLTWHEAREACRRESGGDLISVHDPVEQAFVVVNLKHVKGGVWLGLYRETNSTEFFWSDNSLKSFTNWAPNQPDVPRTQTTCVVANNSLSNAGLWSDVDCSDRNGFVCRIRKGEPYVSPPLLGSCPDGWEKFEKSCYMFQRTHLQPWTAARLSCQRRGGNLASITSQHEQDFYAFHVGKKEKVAVWIGLNDRALERGYMWSDGSPVTLLNWGPGEPTDTTGSENCVLMLGDGQWIDGGCYSKFGYICKRPLECIEPLGMVSRSISSSQVTASSSVDPAYGPAMARLNSLSAWCTKASQHEQSIQVYLLAESRLTEIATQGFYLAGVSSYVTTFKLQTSDDAVAWKTYQKNGKDWVFVANRDASTVTKLTLKPAVDTRFVRLLPLSWVNVICLRMELYGCKFACEAPLGMKSGEIRDEFLSASSIIDNSHSATQARPSGTAWGAKTSDTEPWLEIDFPETEWKISKLTTWGGETGYVTVYRLAYKGDTTNWTDYTEGGRIRNFRGNQDAVSPLSHVLAEPIITQLLRVRPLSWSTSGAYLRLEIFGCQNGCDTALGLRQGVIKDSALSASTSLDQAHAATEGRLNGNTGWCASDKDTKPYLVIDLEGLMRVRKVALQGAADDIAYVKTYTVSFKERVDSQWKALEKDGKPKLFVANSDSTSVVTNTFASALRARFIKILPVSWNTRACFRLELYGCPPALQPTVTPPSVFPSGNPAQPEDVVYTGSVRLSKEKWTDDYRDSKSDAYKTLAKKLLSAIASLYYGVDEASLAFKQFEVTGFRPGSVIAMFKLTFYRDMAEDAGVDVKSKLVVAVRSGNLGQLEIDPDSLKLSRDDLKPTVAAKDATAAAARGSSSGLSSGAKAGIAVAVLLVFVVCAAAFAWWYRNNRREKSFSFKYHRNQQVSFSSKTEEAELL